VVREPKEIEEVKEVKEAAKTPPFAQNQKSGALDTGSSKLGCGVTQRGRVGI